MLRCTECSRIYDDIDPPVWTERTPPVWIGRTPCPVCISSFNDAEPISLEEE